MNFSIAATHLKHNLICTPFHHLSNSKKCGTLRLLAYANSYNDRLLIKTAEMSRKTKNERKTKNINTLF
jgi:hypothetical protein